MTDAQTMTLPDGRTLGYAEFGDPKGRPVLYFHGFPSSRVEARLMADSAAARNVRIIAVDRPGMGLSSFQPKRRFVDWPKDVTALADHLGFDEFVVAGWSGGGPYAAVCARALPERVTAAVLLAGVGPINAPCSMDGMSAQNKIIFGLSRWAHPLAGLPYILIEKQLPNREQVIKQISRSSSPEDRLFLEERPGVVETLYETLVEAFRQGSRGARRELYLYSHRWGFRLDRIQVPVFLWQGEKDANVPPSMGRYQAEQIPNCTPMFLPDDGHLGCIANHFDDVFAAALPN
jgi:pimeloyl-ACP methyl ester carboxylesterase